MWYTTSRYPNPDHIAKLQSESNQLRRAMTKLRTEVDAVETKVDAVTWTGHWATDARQALARVYRDLRLQAQQMSVLKDGLATHSRWLAAEERRLAEVEDAVRTELAARADEGATVRTLNGYEGWDWDEVARVEQVVAPSPASNRELAARVAGLYYPN